MANQKEKFSLEEFKKPEVQERIRRSFTLAGKVEGELDKLHKEVEELGPQGMLELTKGLKARAEEDAEALGQLHASRAIIERMPGWEESDYKAQHDKIVERITSLGKKNPYAVPLAQKEARKHAYERRKVYREEVEEIRADAITLSEACQGKEGGVAVPVQLPKKEGGTLRGWVRLEVRNGKARIEKTTSTVKFLEKYGATEEGLPIWIQLSPPNFQTPRGESFFPRSVREVLAKRWQAELSGKIEAEVPEEAPVE